MCSKLCHIHRYLPEGRNHADVCLCIASDRGSCSGGGCIIVAGADAMADGLSEASPTGESSGAGINPIPGRLRKLCGKNTKEHHI